MRNASALWLNYPFNDSRVLVLLHYPYPDESIADGVFRKKGGVIMNADTKRKIVELDTVATGLRIKRLMFERELTIRDVSDTMKVSFQAVYRWQRGETLPTISNLYILGQLLGTGVDAMLVGKK